MSSLINDSFMNPDRFGYSLVPFKVSIDKEPRKDIELWRMRRSSARSMGKRTFMHTRACKSCNSFERRVYNNECFNCWKLEKSK